MSKVSANYPSYSDSSVSFGGSSASTGVQNGSLKSSYEMSKHEAEIYNYALSTIANILPQLNTFSADTQKSLQSQVDAFKTQGLQNINQAYEPLIKNLENDIASRFGNLDNSMFSDSLNNIETERAKAVSSFAQNIMAKQSSLESDELTKRYSLVNLLDGLANNTYNNALKSLNLALGGSSSANNYNNDLYNAISSLKNTNSGYNLDTSALILGLLGGSGANPTTEIFKSFL